MVLKVVKFVQKGIFVKKELKKNVRKIQPALKELIPAENVRKGPIPHLEQVFVVLMVKNTIKRHKNVLPVQKEKIVIALNLNPILTEKEVVLAV